MLSNAIDTLVRSQRIAAALSLHLRRCFIYASPPPRSTISVPPARRAPAHPRRAGAHGQPRESAQPMAENCPSSAEARSKLRPPHPAAEVGSRTGCIACQRRAAPYRRGDERDGPHGPNASPRPERLLCELSYKKLDRGLFEIPLAEVDGGTSVSVSETTFEAIFAGLQTRVSFPTLH